MNGLMGSEEDADEEQVNGAFEEYEWCGETRIRATALARQELMSGVSGFHIIKNAEDDEADQVLSDRDRLPSRVAIWPIFSFHKNKMDVSYNKREYFVGSLRVHLYIS